VAVFVVGTSRSPRSVEKLFGAVIPARSTLDSLRDRKLERDLRHQDPTAVERIGRRFGSIVLGYLTSVLGDRGAAEDAMQMTMVEVWRRGPSYDPNRGSLATWVLTIARSRALDQLRRRVPEPLYPGAVTQALDRDAEDALDALLEQWRMAALMSNLPKEESRLLSMRFYEGLSQREIAQRTGIPLGTVKMRMVQALERLRDLIEREDR
jgi:RNA polymerase sigma-70 factor, ECF subfamily